MDLVDPEGPPVRRFDGTRRLHRRVAAWPGLSVELNTVAVHVPARSELCVPGHTLLGVVRGGAQGVTVKADGAAQWRGPKLVGAAGFFPAGRPRVTEWPTTGELTYLILFIAPGATDELLGRGTGGAAWRTRPQAEDPFLSAGLARLAQALGRADADPLEALVAETLATTLHLHAAERFSDLRGPSCGRPHGLAAGDDGVERALDLIHAELPRGVPLSRMVEASGLPRGRFLRAFQRRTGTSPHQFILQERLARARALLETTRRPVAQVAQDVGCANPGHLTQLFRRHLGTTPSAWRHERGRS